MGTFVSGSQNPIQVNPISIRKPVDCALILIVFAIGLVGCICIGMTGFAALGLSIATQKAPIERTLNEFMKAMSKRDSARAYSLVSTRARQFVSAADVQEGLHGANFALFSGYLGIELTEMNLTCVGKAPVDEPQGLIATVSARLSYADGYSGDLEGVLEQEQDVWRIWNFSVTVPPAKISNEPQDIGVKHFIDIGRCRCYTGYDNRIANELSAPMTHTGDSTHRPLVTINSSRCTPEVSI